MSIMTKEVQIPEQIVSDSCFDCPDRRDHTPEQIFGSELPPDRFDGDIDLRNIRTRAQKENSCTSHGLANVIMIMLRLGNYKNQDDNITENLDADIDVLWARQHIKQKNSRGEKIWGTGTATPSGDSLQSALKTARYAGLPVLIGNKKINVKIKSYARIQDEETNDYLKRGFPIYSGWIWQYKKRKTGVLSATDDNGYLWEGRKGGGHCVCITGKTGDDNRILNTHGEKWNGDGTAGITTAKRKESFSKYIVELDWEVIRKDLKNQ